jgi:hypothetical protein
MHIPTLAEFDLWPVFTVTLYAGPTRKFRAETACDALRMAQTAEHTTATGVVRDAAGNLV